MDNIDVTIQQQPSIQVTVIPSPLRIAVSKLGIQGPPGIPASGSYPEFATFTGNAQNFITNIISGNDNYFISFPYNFSSIPKVNISLEVPDNYTYGIAISGIMTSGFTVIFSDNIAESGIILNTYATIND